MATYASYKDSGEQWLGQIPSHWEMKRWRFLMEENVDQNTDCAITTQLQFKYGEIVQKANQTVDDDVLKTICKYTIVRPNDIMINGLNLNYDFISQRIGQVRENGVITSAYISLRPTAVANHKYLVYLLKAMDAQKLFHGMGTGVRLTLSYKELKNKYLPVPSLVEQNAMVAYLDEATSQIDEAIAQQQHMIDLLNERKQIIIQNAVTKGLNPEVPMKVSGVEAIGEVPEHWDVVPFKTYFTYGRGLNITKENLTESGVPVISYGQVHSKLSKMYCITDDLIRFVPESYLKQENCLVHKGDFIFADTSEDFEGCGNSVYVDKEMTLFAGYHTLVARPKDRSQDYTYFSFLLMSRGWRTGVRKLVNGVKVYTVSRGILSKTRLLVPPIDEQKKICEFLIKETTTIDNTISLAQKKIELLRERRQIVVSEVVTGKVKVD